LFLINSYGVILIVVFQNTSGLAARRKRF